MFSDRPPQLSDFDRETFRAVVLAYRRRRFAHKTELVAFRAAQRAFLARHPSVDPMEAGRLVYRMIAVATRHYTDWFWRGYESRHQKIPPPEAHVDDLPDE